jgi:GTP-binding protein
MSSRNARSGSKLLFRAQNLSRQIFFLSRRLPCTTQTLETIGMRILARFMLSASDLSHFPSPGVPEIAFLGRSNVGKSSVINSLVGTKLARTSNTPGRTRSINFYEVRKAGQPRPELLFADLPGYGYAKVSREISDDWARFVDPYLHQRSSLALCLALVDSNITPQESDRQLLEFLSTKGRPHIVVATKCDRLSGNKLQQAMQTLGSAYGSPIVPFSAKTGAGKDELWRQIRKVVSEAPSE